MVKSVGLKSMIITFLIIGLFSFALISFGVNFPDNNLANQSLLDDQRINTSYSQLSTELQDTKTTSEAQLDVLEETEAETGSENVVFRSVASVWKAFKSMSIGLFNIVFGLIFDVLLGQAFVAVVGVIGAIVTLLIAFYVWKWVRTGDPD